MLRDAVEDILWIMERLTESPMDRDREGREVVHLPAMPKTAVVHAQVRAGLPARGASGGMGEV